MAVIEGRRRCSVGDADRRVLIAVTELDSRRIVLKLFRARAHDRGASFFAQLSSFFAVFFDLGRERGLVIEAGAHFGGFIDVDHCDGLALGRVAVEQTGPGPTLQHRGKLPAYIDGVANPRVHAETACRPVQVCGITGEKDAIVLIPLGHDTVPGPGADGK